MLCTRHLNELGNFSSVAIPYFRQRKNGEFSAKFRPERGRNNLAQGNALGIAAHRKRAPNGRYNMLGFRQIRTFANARASDCHVTGARQDAASLEPTIQPIEASPVRYLAASKTFCPATYVALAKISSLRTTRSASAPTSRTPFRSASPSARAGFSVAMRTASCSGTPTI